MKSKIASVILNSGLLVVVLALLSAPLLMGQLLGEFESGALGVATTETPTTQSATAVTSSGIAVYPNVTDFTEYAEFAEEPQISEHAYQTAVTFTAFSGQQAAYNSLFTIYNTSSTMLEVYVEGGKLSAPLNKSQIWLNVVLDGGVASTLVTDASKKDDTLIRVAQTEGFSGGEIVVDGQVLKAAEVSSTAITLASKLKSAFAVGQRVYFGPVYYNQSATPLPAKTQTIKLQPQQRATINLTVATEASETATSQSVLPIVIRTK